jgi:hypothetical protein
MVKQPFSSSTMCPNGFVNSMMFEFPVLLFADSEPHKLDGPPATKYRETDLGPLEVIPTGSRSMDAALCARRGFLFRMEQTSSDGSHRLDVRNLAAISLRDEPEWCASRKALEDRIGNLQNERKCNMSQSAVPLE